MITVACVFKSAGDYDAGYVERLATAVHRTLSLPHRFVCLSDVPHKIGMDLKSHVDQMILLRHDWPSWWAKMEMFNLPGPVLYLDLDTVLIDSINELADWVTRSKDCLLMLRDFYTNKRSTGILGWNGDLRWITDSFIEQVASGATWRQQSHAVHLITKRGRFRGDQDWLRSFLPDHPELSVALAQDVMPGIYSYKVHVREHNAVPNDARIICFHGRPRPHQIQTAPWMAEFWGASAISLQETK